MLDHILEEHDNPENFFFHNMFFTWVVVQHDHWPSWHEIHSRLPKRNVQFTKIPNRKISILFLWKNSSIRYKLYFCFLPTQIHCVFTNFSKMKNFEIFFLVKLEHLICKFFVYCDFEGFQDLLGHPRNITLRFILSNWAFWLPTSVPISVAILRKFPIMVDTCCIFSSISSSRSSLVILKKVNQNGC